MAQGQNGRATQPRDWGVFGPLDPMSVYPEGHPDAGQPVRLPVDPAEVEQMAADVATVARMVGGTIASGSDRERHPFSGMWITTAMYWRWHPFAPTSRAPQESRGKRGGQQQQQQEPPAAEFQEPGPAPQEPAPEEMEDDAHGDEFMPLTEAEERQVALEEGALN